METVNSVSRTISTSLRPARIAILLNANDPDWMNTCLRVIEWSTSVWGGMYTCLVPTDGTEIEERFWQLLERFDPDYVYAYQKTSLDLKIAHPDRFRAMLETRTKQWIEQYPHANGNHTLQLIEEQEEQLEGAWTESFNITPELYKMILRRLNPFQMEGNTSPEYITARPENVPFPLTGIGQLTPVLSAPLRVTVLDMEASTPIQLLTYAKAGKIWPDLQQKLEKDVEFHTTSHSLNTFHTLWGEGPYTFALPGANCALYHSAGQFPDRLPALVVVGDHLEDFCLHYTVDKMRGRTYWMPKSLVETYHSRLNHGKQDASVYYENEDNIYRYFLLFLNRNKRLNPVHFASNSIAADELETLAKEMAAEAGRQVGEESGFDIDVNFDIETIMPYVRRLYERDNVGRRYRDQFHDGLSVNFVDTPKPKHLKTVPPYDLFWIAEVTVENYQLPRRSEFGPKTIVHPNYGTENVRVSREGFAYFCPYHSYFGGDIDTNLVKPRIHLMEPLAVFERLFASAGYHIGYSDKGNYHLECRAKWGSLEELAAFFRDKTTRSLLDTYVKTPSKKTDKNEIAAMEGVFLKDRRYLDFASISEIMGSVRTPVELIDDLVAKGVLHRGFIFQCEACRNSDWYAIEDVTNQFVCSRCRRSQLYTKRHWKKPEEPAWYYKPDEIVYQGYSHNMHVPTLTLRLLEREAKNSFFYVPEIELRTNPASEKPGMELDFCCCSDGNIIIGEAKKEDRLGDPAAAEKKSLVEYSKIASDVGASIVALSTFSDEWREVTVANAEKIVGKERLKLVKKIDLLS